MANIRPQLKTKSFILCIFLKKQSKTHPGSKIESKLSDYGLGVQKKIMVKYVHHRWDAILKAKQTHVHAMWRPVVRRMFSVLYAESVFSVDLADGI